jgi:6-phosphogluconolactonase
MFAYVGSRTTRERNARGEGISVYEVDKVSGKMQLIQVVGGLVNPSYLALNRSCTRLYCVHGDTFDASVFSINKENGTIQHLQTISCGGKNPVHLALDPSEKWLIVANHLSHNVSVLPVLANGLLGNVIQTMLLEGEPGPHRKEQPFSKPHFSIFDPSGRFVLVPDKGLDCIFSFEFSNGVLRSLATPPAVAREGAGPRHIAFHPSGIYAYAINELDSTVTAYYFNKKSGALSAFQVLPSLIDTFTGTSRGAAIEVSRNGQFVYASNRGANNIASFQLDETTGRLQFIDTFASGGKTPRFFTQSPNGKHLFVLNEDSDSIEVLPTMQGSGILGAPLTTLANPSPVCMVFGHSSNYYQPAFKNAL